MANIAPLVSVSAVIRFSEIKIAADLGGKLRPGQVGTGSTLSRAT